MYKRQVPSIGTDDLHDKEYCELSPEISWQGSHITAGSDKFDDNTKNVEQYEL